MSRQEKRYFAAAARVDERFTARTIQAKNAYEASDTPETRALYSAAYKEALRFQRRSYRRLSKMSKAISIRARCGARS